MKTSPRVPWLAGLASFATLGLGQLYNGEARAMFAFWAAGGILTLLTFLAVVSGAFALPLMITGLLALFALQLASIIQAVRSARRLGASYELRPFNRVVVYVGILIAASIGRESLTFVLRESVGQAFRIPSEAMLPTLLVGDHVFVDRLPSSRTPGRGDIIAFHYPEDPRRDYLKRIVGLPGDEVEVRDKLLRIRGRAVAEPYVQHIDPTVRPATSDPRDNYGPFVVPRGAYFVMGDNRDNSNDSRFWGPVEARLVLGRVAWIYWSWDAERQRVRWERIGMRFDARARSY